jgi:hypothetical protein
MDQVAARRVVVSERQSACAPEKREKAQGTKIARPGQADLLRTPAPAVTQHEEQGWAEAYLRAVAQAIAWPAVSRILKTAGRHRPGNVMKRVVELLRVAAAMRRKFVQPTAYSRRSFNDSTGARSYVRNLRNQLSVEIFAEEIENLSHSLRRLTG